MKKFHKFCCYFFEVLKSGMHIFSDRMCLASLMMHENYLDFGVFNQVRDGPHALVHENAANCLVL